MNALRQLGKLDDANHLLFVDQPDLVAAQLQKLLGAT
jgi:pimeloyl-ACP methyl ester carboxylesterase